MNKQAERKHNTTKLIGAIARDYRICHGVPLKALSDDTGFSSQLLLAFEQGRTSNYIILLDGYFQLGTMDQQYNLLDKLCEVIENGKP